MKSLKNLFNLDDFNEIGINAIHGQFKSAYAIQEQIKHTCQSILDQFIEENGVKVYGYKIDNLLKAFSEKNTDYDTHSAILLNIQPLKQCEHKEAVYVEDQDKTWFKCRDCGKPVKAKGWDEL